VTVVSAEPLGIVPVSAVQGFSAATVGFPVESTVVVVYVQAQVTSRFVVPLTREVKVRDCDTMIVAEAGLTATLITFVLLPPPQPARTTRKIAKRLGRSRK
jgi:hypothetical protein